MSAIYANIMHCSSTLGYMYIASCALLSPAGPPTQRLPISKSRSSSTSTAHIACCLRFAPYLLRLGRIIKAHCAFVCRRRRRRRRRRNRVSCWRRGVGGRRRGWVDEVIVV